MVIKTAEKEHIKKLTEIYNYYVRNSTATFNLKDFNESQFEEAFYHFGKLSGTYTIMDEDRVVGFCCISRFNPKEAYDRSAYVSIYLEPESTGRGMGSEILFFLEKEAYEKGIRSLIALISKENTASAALFSKNGYRLAGELKEAGEKFNRLIDVVYYQKSL